MRSAHTSYREKSMNILLYVIGWSFAVPLAWLILSTIWPATFWYTGSIWGALAIHMIIGFFVGIISAND